MDKSIFFSSALELKSKLINGEIISTDLINDFYNHIKKHNSRINAFVIENKQEALETARKLDLSL